MVDTAGLFYYWPGEDCFLGYYWYTGYPRCHPFDGLLILTQTNTSNPLYEGVTTYLSADVQTGLTYYAETTTGDCYAWGHQPSYYAAAGCLLLP